MTPEQRTALQNELAALKRKAQARRNLGGYADNVAAIEKRVAEIEAQLAAV